MTLRTCLAEKFPDAGKEEILRVRFVKICENINFMNFIVLPEINMFVFFKVVGNLIYYRYMNPAIVAPDAFDIVDISVEKSLTVEQVSVKKLPRTVTPVKSTEKHRTF